MRERDGACYVEAALVLFLDGDIRWLFVDPDAETLQFVLDHPLVRERFVDVENYEDQMAGLCDRNDLSTSSSPILGALDDTWQVDDL